MRQSRDYYEPESDRAVGRGVVVKRPPGRPPPQLALMQPNKHAGRRSRSELENAIRSVDA